MAEERVATRPLDAPLLERTDPGLARPLAHPLRSARADILAGAEMLAELPAEAMGKEWLWIGGSDQEVRYGAYRAAEALESAESEARSIVSHEDSGETRAARIVGPATAARWDLHGLLSSVDQAPLDANPGRDEWTIRLVIGHIISSQRAYGWGTAWWLANPYEVGDPDLPKGVPDEMWETLPGEATVEAEGTLSDLRHRLDETLDLSVERLAGLSDDRLSLAARWSGYPVDIGFRLGRWSSHLREHTIQIEKTLAMLGVVPDEPKRLVRHVLGAYGRAESVVFGRRPGTASEEAARRIAEGAAEAREAIASAAEAVRAYREERE